MVERLKDFEDSINFIAPKIIPSADEKNAYVNLKKEQPNAKENRSSNKNSTFSGQDSSSPNNFEKKDSSQNSAEQSSGTFSSDYLEDNNLQYNTKNQNLSSNKLPLGTKKIKGQEKKKFGQHENFSFFESFAREMIFQIFEYRPMYFFGYTVKKTDIESEQKKEANSVLPISIISNNKRGGGEEEIKSGEKSGENEKFKKEIETKESQKEEEKEECPKKKEKEECQEKKQKYEVKKEEKESNDEKRSNKEKEENLKEKNENKEAKTLSGDIDFLLPNVSPEELKNVLTKKELAPFIFYGNIDKDKHSDLIGEIKESIKSGDKKHINQFNKYRKIFKLCETNEKICKQFGIKKDNQKIVFYVFNSDYNEYLNKMLIYGAHRKTFRERNDSKQAVILFEFYSKLYKDDKQDKQKENKKYDFIKTIIDSNLAYIFIFIQDIITLNSLLIKNVKKEKDDQILNEIKELKKEIESLKKKDLEKSQLIETQRKEIEKLNLNIKDLEKKK